MNRCSRSNRQLRTVVCLLACTYALLAEPALAGPLSVSEFYVLARHCAPSVAPSTLAALAKVESGFRPLVIHDNADGKLSVSTDVHQAAATAYRLMSAGHSIDLGLMQINSANLPALQLTPEQAFEPCSSIRAAAALLAANYVGDETRRGQQAALRKAISVYNTGNTERGFANGYVQKVEVAARQIVPALETERFQPEPAQPPATDRSGPPSWDVWGSYQYEQTLTTQPAPRKSIGQRPQKSQDDADQRQFD